MTDQEYGLLSQKRVRNWIRMRLPKVKVVNLPQVGSKWDLLVNWHHVEVKASRFQDGEWKFNIHRHNVVNEVGVELYILRLDDFPYSKKALHLVMPAPLERYTITVTIRSLLTKYHRYLDDLKFFT